MNIGTCYNERVKRELIVLCHNIRSTYNVGSFFRTADGAGVTKLVLSGYTARPPHRGIAKVALGAETWLPWEYVKAPGPWLKRMKKAGYHVAVLEQTPRAGNIFTWPPRWPLILIVGNEVRGVSPALQRCADTHLEIPMRGRKESLNVASAMAIAVYSLLYGHT
ncbi:MAG: TrmH family RNA methyltransferase [Patescibacteria group bacterium]